MPSLTICWLMLNLAKHSCLKSFNRVDFIWALLDKLAGLLMKVSAPLTRNVLAPLATTTLAVAIDTAILRETRGWGAIATSGIKIKKSAEIQVY